MAYKDPAARRAYERARRMTPERKAYMKAYKAAPEIRAYHKAYDKALLGTPRGKALSAAKGANRTARIFGVPGTITGRQLLRLYAEYENRCVCCGKKGKLGPDHVIPLSRGGSNFINNIQPMLLSCNLRKGNRSTDYRFKGAAFPPAPAHFPNPNTERGDFYG
jgi:5-methylcytosine-specific restriction endonuclease McrA